MADVFSLKGHNVAFSKGGIVVADTAQHCNPVFRCNAIEQGSGEIFDDVFDGNDKRRKK